MPETGARYGVVGDERRSGAQKLLDPGTNLHVGTRYLRDLLVRFANDVALALAAYNAGEGTVALHDNNVPPFAETRDYVRLVQEFSALFRRQSPACEPRVRIVKRTDQPFNLRSCASTRSNVRP